MTILDVVAIVILLVGMVVGVKLARFVTAAAAGLVVTAILIGAAALAVESLADVRAPSEGLVGRCRDCLVESAVELGWKASADEPNGDDHQNHDERATHQSVQP